MTYDFGRSSFGLQAYQHLHGLELDIVSSHSVAKCCGFELLTSAYQQVFTE